MMATTRSTTPLHPVVLWAQRNDKLFLTIEIWEVCDEKFSFTINGMSFQGTNNETRQQYAVDLEFYANIIPDQVIRQAGKRCIMLTIPKEASGPFWPRLTKSTSKFHFIKTDFSKWVDEDDTNDSPSMPDFDSGNFDFGNMGDAGQYDYENDENDSDGDHDEELLDKNIKERALHDQINDSASLSASSE